MAMRILRFIILAVAALVLTGPSNAEVLPEKPGPARTVKMFELFCLNVVPDISRTAEAAAAGDFTEIKGKKLEKFQPQMRAEELRGWSYADFGSEFVLTTARSKPDAQFKKEAPQFADTKSFACSLIIPAKENRAKVLKRMKGLFGRDSDESWNEGPYRVHSWGGQTDSMLIFVYFYAPTKRGHRGILSATTFVKQ